MRDAEGILVSDDKVWLYTRDFSSSPLDQTLQILSKNTAQTAVLGNTEGEYSKRACREHLITEVLLV